MTSKKKKEENEKFLEGLDFRDLWTTLGVSKEGSSKI